MARCKVSSYILGLRVPNVSLTVENVADFLSAYIIGNLLQMAFRFWAFRRCSPTRSTAIPNWRWSPRSPAAGSSRYPGRVRGAPRQRDAAAPARRQAPVIRHLRSPPDRGLPPSGLAGNSAADADG